jgi:hypothetical protein
VDPYLFIVCYSSKSIPQGFEQIPAAVVGGLGHGGKCSLPLKCHRLIADGPGQKSHGCMTDPADDNTDEGKQSMKLELPASCRTEPMKVLLTGAAGFLGSHLAEALVELGHDVTGVDSLITGARDNLQSLENNPRFRLIEHDLATGLPPSVAAGQYDRIWHLASPASPVGYVKHQVITLKVNAMATISLLELAQRCKARMFIASTSECYGDPLEHPQRETYWGHVNPETETGTQLVLPWADGFGAVNVSFRLTSYVIDQRHELRWLRFLYWPMISNRRTGGAREEGTIETSHQYPILPAPRFQHTSSSIEWRHE